MNQLTKTKIENGTLVLPQTIRNLWRNKDVLVLPEKNRIIVQMVEDKWNEYEKKIGKNGKKISSKIINEATQWAKNNFNSIKSNQ